MGAHNALGLHTKERAERADKSAARVDDSDLGLCIPDEDSTSVSLKEDTGTEAEWMTATGAV